LSEEVRSVQNAYLPSVIQIQKFVLNVAAGGSELLNHHTSNFLILVSLCL